MLLYNLALRIKATAVNSLIRSISITYVLSAQL